jgi:hypothetical protein
MVPCQCGGGSRPSLGPQKSSTFATPAFSGGFSQSLLAQPLEILHVSVLPNTLDVLDSILRKFAHLIEYAIFGSSCMRPLAGRVAYLGGRAWPFSVWWQTPHMRSPMSFIKFLVPDAILH